MSSIKEKKGSLLARAESEDANVVKNSQIQAEQVTHT